MTHVCLKMRRSCSGVIAMFATETFFSGMKHHVFLEVRRIFGGVSALFATERFSHMAFQTANITCVFALVATVGLFSVI